MVKIKIKPSELRKKSVEELLKIKKQLEFHISQGRLKKKVEELLKIKKHIARINTILKTKNAN